MKYDDFQAVASFGLTGTHLGCWLTCAGPAATTLPEKARGNSLDAAAPGPSLHSLTVTAVEFADVAVDDEECLLKRQR